MDIGYLLKNQKITCKWWAVRDSNPGLPACKAGALTRIGRSPKLQPLAEYLLILLLVIRGAITTYLHPGNQRYVTAGTNSYLLGSSLRGLCASLPPSPFAANLLLLRNTVDAVPHRVGFIQSQLRGKPLQKFKLRRR